MNEIRGLNFDYLFISGLCDGDFPTRYSPEIFFSGAYVKSEIYHQTEERYHSLKPFRYVLEVNQGWFKKRSIKAGDVVEIKLPVTLNIR